MKPYEHKKLIEFPDVYDIRHEGRHSAVGKFPGKYGEYRPYCRGSKKRAIRRSLKRADKAQAEKTWTKEME